MESSLKDILLIKIAKDLDIEENICDKVISWSYKKAKEATHFNNEVELTGFGKLYISNSRVEKTFAKFNDIVAASEGKLLTMEDSAEINRWQKRVVDAKEVVDYMKKKINRKNEQIIRVLKIDT